MPLDNGKISVSHSLLDWLFQTGASAPTIRLIIAMIHHQDQFGLWDETYVEDAHAARTHATGSVLRGRVGPKRDNGARTLKRLVEETRETGLFDSIHLQDRNTVLCWQFAPWVQGQMHHRWNADFALLNLDHVAQCRTARTLRLYIEAQSRYKMKAPAFTGPVPGSWRRYRHPLLSSCQEVARLVDTVFFVGLVPDPHEPGEVSLAFRMQHPGTRWYPGALMKFPAGTRVFRVDPATAREIDPRRFENDALEDEDPVEVEVNLAANLP